MNRSRAYRRFKYFIKKRWAKKIWKLSSMLLSAREVEKQENHGYDSLIGKLASSPKHIKHDNEYQKQHYSRSKEKRITKMLLKESL